MPSALVIGGSGTSGRHILGGLLDRGYDVAMFHRGVHEPPELPDVEHIHGDPHFEDSIEQALGARDFDLVVAMYGRLRLIAERMRQRCAQFIGTTGCVVWENSMEPQGIRPSGMPILASEEDPPADANGEAPYFAARVLAAERAVLGAAKAGDYIGTIIRYPRLYGPYDVVPREWSVIRRIQDGRRLIFDIDNGLTLHTRCAAKNAAHALLLAVDNPELANGEDFNVGDDDQYTVRQWLEIVMDAAGGHLDIVSLPLDIGEATFAEQDGGLEGRDTQHILVDTSKIRNVLGYRDVIEAKEAIGEYVQWIMANPPTDDDLKTNYQGFQDPFDYDAEDRLLQAWQEAVERINKEVVLNVPERHHPLPHPKAEAGASRDERGR